MFKTDEVARFFAAWQALRTEKAIPHYRAIFQDLPKEMIPQLMILEQAPLQNEGAGEADPGYSPGYTVRFMGTRLAGIMNYDFTGEEVRTLFPKLAQPARRNLAALLTQPCGLSTLGVFANMARTDLRIETAVLPAANDPGRPARVIFFAQGLPAPFPLDDERPDRATRRWIDIGHGTPAKGPWG